MYNSEYLINIVYIVNIYCVIRFEYIVIVIIEGFYKV